MSDSRSFNSIQLVNNNNNNNNNNPADEVAHLLPGHDGELENVPAPSWEDINASYELLIRSKPPTSATLDELPIFNTGFVRYGNELYYVKINTAECTLVPKVTEETLQRFDWEEKKSHMLLLREQPPTLGTLNNLLIENAAYIRCRDGLYYVNKNEGVCTLLDALHEDQLSRFDLELGIQYTKEGNFANNQVNRRKQLSSDALNKIVDITGYETRPARKFETSELNKLIDLTGFDPRPRRQRYLAKLGYFVSAIFAAGCGVSTAAAFITLNLVTGGVAPFIIAALLFTAGTAVNWWIFKRYVPDVLIDLFGRGKLFKSLREGKDGKPLSWTKKALMGVAFALSLSVGITFAALTYGSTFTLTTAFTFMAAASAVFPPLAAILAGVTLICMTALMIKDIAELLREEDVIGECFKFLKNMVSTDPTLPQNQGKSARRILFERIATVALTAVFLPLAFIGLYMTMNACAPGVKAILMTKIPQAADALSKVIALGLAFVGQIPFGIQAAFKTVTKFFGPIKQNDGKSIAQPDSTSASAWKAVKLLSVFDNAIGNGLIPMMGAVGPTEKVFAMASGFGNSACAGIPAVLVADPLYQKPVLKAQNHDIYRILAGSTDDLTVSKNKPSSPPSSPRASDQRAEEQDVSSEEMDIGSSQLRNALRHNQILTLREKSSSIGQNMHRLFNNDAVRAVRVEEKIEEMPARRPSSAKDDLAVSYRLS